MGEELEEVNDVDVVDWRLGVAMSRAAEEGGRAWRVHVRRAVPADEVSGRIALVDLYMLLLQRWELAK